MIIFTFVHGYSPILYLPVKTDSEHSFYIENAVHRVMYIVSESIPWSITS